MDWHVCHDTAATVKVGNIWFAGLPAWSGFHLVRLGEGLEPAKTSKPASDNSFKSAF